MQTSYLTLPAAQGIAAMHTQLLSLAPNRDDVEGAWMSNDVTVMPDALRSLAKATLEAVGAAPNTASAVAEHMVDANLTGYDSHGIHLLPVYIADIQNGEIHPGAEPEVLWQRDAAALVSGHWGFGQHTGVVAMNLAIDLARRSGIGIVGMVELHHLGRLGAFMDQAAQAGCAALAFVSGLGGAVQAAPYGGSRSAYGANPFAAAFPGQGGDHLMVDYATTLVAGGKVMLARTANRPLAEGALLDRSGKPTTNPDELFNGGALTPFGAHKGYGLALTVELLGRVLTGSDDLGPPAGGGDRFGRSGATFIAIDPLLFRAPGAAAQAAATTFRSIRAVPPVPGIDAVRTPGEHERATRLLRRGAGIRLPVVTVDALRAAALAVGVPAATIEAYLGAG
jgi:hydroxycarboxylate dehydrogenase B